MERVNSATHAFSSPAALPEEGQARAGALLMAALVELDVASVSPAGAIVRGT